jgi:hypothetical protein
MSQQRHYPGAHNPWKGDRRTPAHRPFHPEPPTGGTRFYTGRERRRRLGCDKSDIMAKGPCFLRPLCQGNSRPLCIRLRCAQMKSRKITGLSPNHGRITPCRTVFRQSITGWDLLKTICVSPVVLLAFAVGETQAPERSEGERGGGKTPPLQKPYKTKGDSMLKEDPTLLSITSSARRGQAGNASMSYLII